MVNDTLTQSSLEEAKVSYEELADIERDFDDVEVEIMRKQVALTAPIYSRRTLIVDKIPQFWPLVLEQAPPDIDQYIQPSDSALLLSSLLSISVDRFELDPNAPDIGDPRSFSIKFVFAENEHFTNTTLEKKFWNRMGKDQLTGLVSEPVRIQWKKGKDLTGGMLDLVCDAFEAEKKAANGAAKGLDSKLKEKLLKKIEGTGMGGQSFFAWFGFIGRKISAEESAAAIAKDKEERNKREGKQTSPPTEKEVEDEDMEDEEDESLEIFPDGDELAVAFAEDVWPGALKYFIQAQERDALSDADFESDEEGDLEALLARTVAESDDEEEKKRPAKKRKN